MLQTFFICHDIHLSQERKREGAFYAKMFARKPHHENNEEQPKQAVAQDS